MRPDDYRNLFEQLWANIVQGLGIPANLCVAWDTNYSSLAGHPPPTVQAHVPVEREEPTSTDTLRTLLSSPGDGASAVRFTSEGGICS